MKIKRINNTASKVFVFFVAFSIGKITLADGVASNLDALLEPTLSRLNQEDVEAYPKPSIYTLKEGDSSDFVITKYLFSQDDGISDYSPVDLELSVKNLITDSSGTNYIYYKWQDVGYDGLLSISTSEDSSFYVQYSSDTSISDIASYFSSLDSVGKGDLYYTYDGTSFSFSTENTNAIYAINYDKTYATIKVNADGFLCISVNSDTKNLRGSLSWIFNSTKIASIDGNFYGVHITTVTDLDYNKSAILYGGAIYNYYNSDIGDITGDFIGNYAKSEDNKAYGGAIYNDYRGEIGDITGDFVGNFVYSESADVYGGAICNYYTATIGDITGSFIGNYASTQDAWAKGGAISNDRYSSEIGDIVGDFIGNYAESTRASYGGAIYNASGTIDSISGDFIGNYATGDSILAWGGAICNTDDYPTDPSYIGDITGNFIGNYAESILGLAKGGAIYNTETIANITGDFVGNYSYANSYVEGGTIYNYKATIGDITGDFIGNYATAGTYVKGGVIYSYYESNLGTFTGDFIGNYATAGTYIEGGTIYNYRSTIDEIAGNFVGNYALADTYIKGGIVYTYFESDIGTITGDFIANYAISESSYIYGGIIYNSVTSSMSGINGDFIYNYAQASTSVYGGIIYNGTTSAYSSGSTIDDIIGDFIGNYAISENNDVYGAVIYNEKSYIGTISGDFIGNYAQASSSGNGGVIYNYYNSEIEKIEGNFILNYASGDAVYGGAINNSEATIGDIIGSFVGNYVMSTSSSYYYTNYAQGGAIYNYKSDIGDITGDFIANYSYGVSAAYAGAIYNYSYSSIGDITGNFVGNYAISENSTANGGAIFNYVYATIGDITGDFIGNYAISEATNARGGAIYNNYNGGSIGSITGDFIGNYVSAYGYVTGGAIYNASTASGDATITGDFIANYAISETSWAVGGAIYYATKNFDSITGDFIANYVSGTYATAGAIYNYDNALDYITGDFIANYAISSNELAGGGGYYSYGESASINNLNSNFAYNYTKSTESVAVGGAIYNLNYSTISSIVGDFIGNYAWGYNNAYGGAIYNNEGAQISYISGNFISNYVIATTGEACGGAICNVSIESFDYPDYFLDYKSQINIENANFINNSASGDIAYGGAIYNDSILNYTLQADTYAVATSNTATTAGGFLYNIGSVNFDIESGAVFTVGAYNEDDATDSIYNSGSFVKSGQGTMLIRSSFTNEAYSDGAGGSLSVLGGVLIIEGEDELEDISSAWFYTDAVLSAISSANASFVLGTSMNLGEYLIVGSYEGDIESNTAYFASDSVFAVHVETTNSSGDYDPYSPSSALVGDGNSIVTIEAGATLVIYGASAGTDIRILEDFDGDASSYAKWDIDYISSANPLYEIESVQWRTEENAIDTYSSDEPSTISLDDDTNTPTTFSLFSVAGINDTTDEFAVATIDDDSSTSTSTDSGTSLYISASVDEEAVAEVGQVAEIGGVISNMGLIVNLARDTTMARFSIFDEKFESENETNFGIWATPMYSYTEARGLNAGTKSTGYDMYFGGANLGVDYTLGDAYRLGIAFHGGYGESNSVGDFSPTNNDFGFYSLSLYNGFKIDNLLIYADINFAMTNNDLTQYSSTGASNFYADVDAFAISTELRIDYLIKLDSYSLIPHLGFNYMYLTIDNYDVKFLGESALYINSKGQSIFTIPIGMTFTTSFDMGNDYLLSPIFDLGVIFSLGDLYSKSTASFVDIDATTLSVQAYNHYTFSGLLGLELQKGNTRLGLSYFIEASENITSHNFRLNYRYSF
ncbi:MAG: hypothetical protein R3Y46_05675 [Opitutales bacterium]